MVLTRMTYYPVHIRGNTKYNSSAAIRCGMAYSCLSCLGPLKHSLLVPTVPEGSPTRLGSLQLRKLQDL